MRILSLWILAAVLAGAATGYAATLPTASLHPDSILADVRTRGARAAVATIYADTKEWNHLISHIGRGAREWLAVGAALRPGTDAGASEALDEAMFLALKPAPIEILQLIRDGVFTAAMVCSSNVGIDYTPAQSRSLIKARISVLAKVSDQNVLAERAKCVASLQEALADFDRSKEEGKPR